MMSIRKVARLVRATPLHPQWLMPPRIAPAALCEAKGKVLDIGSADRWLSRRLHESVQYVALDYPATAVAMYGTRPDIFADATQLPFGNESFDAIACFEVLEHVPEPYIALAEIGRVLKPGGIAAISMPFLYPEHDAPHDYQRWTEYRWRLSANQVGLDVESIEPMLHAICAAGTLVCLAIAGPLQRASTISLVARLPLTLFLVPIVNVVTVLLSLVWPSWPALTTGYRILLRKR